MSSLKKNKVVNNIVMLYVLNITQLILPLITLPYLTRVLSISAYGVVSYVKSLIVYATLIIEFGFLLSGTRDIVKANHDKRKMGVILGRITVAKLLLSIVAFIALLMMIKLIPILRNYPLFTILSYVSPFLSIFLFDYFFRGLEKMNIITYRYLIMKGISTVFTFIFVKSDKQLLMIPILDILGSIAAIVLIYIEIKKMGVKIKFDSLTAVFKSLKISFVYFLSNIASTAFGALNTLFVGIYLSSKDVAYWGIIMTLIGAVQSMYTPISDGIYPHMIKEKSLRLFGRILLFFIPVLIIGSLVTYFGADIIMLIIGGNKYIAAAYLLRECIPLLIISFFGVMFGWPSLGAIDKVKETTFSTIIAAVLQVLGLIILIIFKLFTLNILILIRTITELIMVSIRLFYLFKYRKLFNN